SLVQLAVGFAARGARCTLVSWQDGPLRERCAAGEVEVRLLAPRPHPSPAPRLDGLSYALRVARALAATRPALVYLNTVHHWQTAKVAARLGIPAVWCIRESVSPFDVELHPGTPSGFRPGVHPVFVAEATRALYAPVLGGLT